MQKLDGLLEEFDYAGAVVPFDDDWQFVRAETSAGPVFVRRDAAGEAAVLDAIRRDDLSEAPGPTPLQSQSTIFSRC